MNFIDGFVSVFNSKAIGEFFGILTILIIVVALYLVCFNFFWKKWGPQ